MKTDILFLQADDAYDRGDYVTAFALFSKASEQGDRDAMSRLATMYENGEGTPPDLLKSIDWDLKAVLAGSRTSIINLGITFKKLGNISEAEMWFKKAVDEGDGEAAFELAKLHHLQDSASPLVKSYLNLALDTGDLSESTLEEIQEWLSAKPVVRGQV